MIFLVVLIVIGASFALTATGVMLTVGILANAGVVGASLGFWDSFAIALILVFFGALGGAFSAAKD